MSVYSCDCGEYKFYVTYGTVKTEFNTLNFLESSLTYEYEMGEMFYRQKFKGSLIFGGQKLLTDFTYFWTIELDSPCAELIFEIKKNGASYWIGYFSTTDGKFDLDACTFEVTPLVYDEYKSILENYEKQYNILTQPHAVSTQASRGAMSTTYNRNMMLIDCIEYLANDATIGISPGCTLSSDFFTSANNPATTQANQLLLLTIAAKLDIIYPAGPAATSAMLSWKELMDILWGMFQVKWNYDLATDTINVEHISWFTTTGTFDIRNQKMAAGTNKYSYLKDRMPKYEFFEFMEAEEVNFVGTYIYYPSACINETTNINKKTTTVNVTTDIEYIHNYPDAINPDGFVILCNYDDGGYHVVVSLGALYNLHARLNMPLSWANLHNLYYRHYRSAIQGYMNGTLVDFYSAVPSRKQECSIMSCTDFDPEKEIITELGESYFGGVNAIVDRADCKPSGQVDLSLLYPLPGNPIVPYEPKIANFIQTSETTVEVWLSEPSDANYNMHIWEEMYDGDCLFVCSEGQPADPEAFVINTGNTYATFTFADTCTGFVAGYTFWVEIDTAAMVANGWTVYFERDFDYIQSGCP